MGKAAALNAAVREAERPVLVFADARQRFAPDAIRRLASHFDDPAIGAVSGELVIEDAAFGPQPTRSSTVADGVGVYWGYEKWLRRHEAIVGSTVGVTGAIYAMRRVLWQPLPPDTLLDDVLGPMRVVLRGYRVTFDSRALAFDRAAADSNAEYRRKVRTLAGNFQLLAQEPRLLLPVVNPVWLQFVSHKIGRLFVPYALVALFAASLVLATSSWLYAAALVAQAVFYGLALYGAVLEGRRRSTGPRPTEVIRDAA
jgi:cellulose synthase/poly-beta-1,6-N-acetylglucosamine synthase-like glycosyltransferase